MVATLGLGGCDTLTEVVQGEGNAFVYLPEHLAVQVQGMEAHVEVAEWELVRYAGIDAKSYRIGINERVCTRLDRYRYEARLAYGRQVLTEEDGAVYPLKHFRRTSCVDGYAYPLTNRESR